MDLHLNRHARIATLCVAVFVILASFGASSASAATLGCADDTTGVTDLTASWQADLLAATNAHRTGMGLTALQLDATLTRASVWKARDMARRNYFAHDDPAAGDAPARSPWTRLEACGWTTGGSRAENIAAGYATAAATVAGWIASPGHRANIENGALRYVGFGVASSPTSSYTRYQVQMFSSVAGPVGTEPMDPAPPEPTRDPLELIDGGGDDGSGDAATDERAASTLSAATASTVTRTRCRSRLAVAGWCYALVVRGQVQLTDGTPSPDRTVTAARRSAGGTLVRLGSRRTSATGDFTFRVALRPPARGTTTWLQRNATRVRIDVAGTTDAAPVAAWSNGRVRLPR
jgi:uncharacterized protein YkwD